MLLLMLLFIAICMAGSCSDQNDNKKVETSCKDAPVPKTTKGAPYDLGAHWTDPCAKGASATKISDAKQLIGGPAAQGQVGDYLLANSHVRFIIQGPDRHTGPCPWGGNIIDADVIRPDGEAGQDNVGEYCLLFNLGRTILAEQVEVLNDGKNGGPAIIAATGPDTLLDFINLPSMVKQNLPSITNIGFDPEIDLPLTFTRYFILAPESRVVRVVTAIRNDGDAAAHIALGELIDSGGNVEFFNPASTLKGFGYKGLSAEKLDFLAFKGERSSHLYGPPAIDGQPGAAYIGVSGVAGVVVGQDAGLAMLTASPESAKTHPATVTIEPGKVTTRSHLVAVGDGDLASITKPLWSARGLALGTVRGLARDEAGAPIAGVDISVTDPASAAQTQVRSEADGTFTVDLPEGTFFFSAYDPGRSMLKEGKAKVTAGQTVEGVEVVFGPTAHIEISVQDEAGKPVPARVTTYCAAACAHRGKHIHFDVARDRLANNVADITFVGVDGKATIAVVPGPYKVVVTRGPAWSVFPADADKNGGAPVTVQPGATATVHAKIAKVIDTAGWLSGDFHVHAINSPDSPVPNLERVGTFLAEGVDVLVSTDHDVITDLGPYVKMAKAEGLLATIAGVELTTFDYGHFNAFPLKYDAKDIIGGAFDWAGGAGPSLHPQQIRDGLAALGDQPVIQVNHPGGGYFGAIGLDIASGATYADPKQFRIETGPADPKTGDTGLFVENFTALEIYNGFSTSKFNSVANWWFAMLSRGVLWTATAVSDTHNWQSSPSGGPRTWVHVGAGKDTVKPFDEAHFAKAVNAMAAFGSNGPFVEVVASNDAKEKAGLGQTLAVPKGTKVRFEVTVQAPSWMSIDQVDVHRTPTQTAPPTGQSNSTLPAPLKTYTLNSKNKKLIDGTRWQATIEVVDTVSADGYYVFFVRGKTSLLPAVVSGKNVKPFAYTNPIFVDADGGGYNNPPLKKVPPPPPPPAIEQVDGRGPTFDDLRYILDHIEGCSQ